MSSQWRCPLNRGCIKLGLHVSRKENDGGISGSVMCYQERKKRCNIEVKRESQRRTQKKELQIGYGNLCQAPIVQKMDSAIHRLNRYPEDIRKNKYAIQWIVIYPVDSAIHLSNNNPRHTKETFGRSLFSAHLCRSMSAKNSCIDHQTHRLVTTVLLPLNYTL